VHKIYILVHSVFTCHCVCVCASFHPVEHLIIECMINMANTTNQKHVC